MLFGWFLNACASTFSCSGSLGRRRSLPRDFLDDPLPIVILTAT